MKKKPRSLASILATYQNKSFRPENFPDLGRLFGASSTVDLSLLTLTSEHRRHAASAYMRRLRRRKARQQDANLSSLINTPLTIKRVAVDSGYQDPYVKFKSRLPKLCPDLSSTQLTRTEVRGQPYVAHNTLSPHVNTLVKTNPAGYPHKGTRPPDTEPTASVSSSPRKSKSKKPNTKAMLQDQIRKRLGAEAGNPARGSNSSHTSREYQGSTTTGNYQTSGEVSHSAVQSEDLEPEQGLRAAPNSPLQNRAAWNLSLPRQMDYSGRSSHVSSIPPSKYAMSHGNSSPPSKYATVAISTVHKHNKPLPAIVVKM